MVTTAKHLLTVLLVSVTLASPPKANGTIRDEKLGFEITLPKEVDWERSATRPDSPWKAHFRTYFRDAAMPSEADLRLLVVSSGPRESLKEAAERLRPTFEKAVTETARRKQIEAKLDGEPCVVVDLVGKGGATRYHVTWRVARLGGRLYVLSAHRTNEAIGDAGIEKELAGIIGTFRFLRRQEPPPAPPPSPDVSPPTPRKEYRLAHWRLECVKPAGLKEVPPEELDKRNGVILRFEGRAEQTRCLVRIYAHLHATARRVPLDELARRKVARFQEQHARRLEPVTGRWKLPLARRALRLKLTAKRLVPEVTRWFLADCRNERRYEIEIITTGQAWEAAIAELLERFQPRRRLR